VRVAIPHRSYPDGMQLDTVRAGDDVEVVAMGLPEALALRVGELGLRVGTSLRVLHFGPRGSRVVGFGGARLALDGATVARIEVRSRP
jgi:ferrous iron transport protein A